MTPEEMREAVFNATVLLASMKADGKDVDAAIDWLAEHADDPEALGSLQEEQEQPADKKPWRRDGKKWVR